MATTAAPPTDRPHRAAKRYIYAWGEGTAEGNGGMKDLLGGKGAGPRRDDDRGPARRRPASRSRPRPATTTSPPASSSRTGSGTTSSRRCARSSGGPARASATPANPLLVSVRSGREVLDARDDGHGPQPRAQRGDAPGPHRAHRQRAVRLGRLPAVHPDVRPDRDGREGRAVRPRRSRRARHATASAAQDTDLDGRRPEGAGRRVQGDRPRGHGPRLPDRPERAARPRDQGRLRELVRQARPRLPSEPEDRRRPRHRGQRRDDGLRQHGRRLRDRRRLHPRPEHRRARPVRRVPDERPGRGRRRRHPDARRRSPRWRPTCPAVYDEFQRIGQQLEQPLPRRPGPRVHDRERPPVHAPDALRQADRRGGGADRGRHGRRGHDHARRRRSPGSSRPTSTSSSARRSTRPRSRAPRRSSTGLNASPGAAVGRAVFDADDAVEWVEPRREGRSSSGSRPRRTTSTAWPSARGSSPPAAARPRTPPSSPARSASRASPARPTCWSTTPRRARPVP